MLNVCTKCGSVRPSPLNKLVAEFFSILDEKEESDSGRVFNPVHISSCRVMKSARLTEMFKEMKEIIGYKPPHVPEPTVSKDIRDEQLERLLQD